MSPSGSPGGVPLAEWDERFRLLVESVQDYAIFLLDPTGIILSWNVGAERLKGYTAAEIIGSHFSRFYPEEAKARKWPQHELQLARERGRFEDEGWRIRKDGSRFWANVIITSMVESTGRHLGFSKITRDLTERRRHEELLHRSEERFRLLVEGVQDYAIFMLDPNGVVASWNSGAERIKGYRADEIIGKHFSVFYPAEAVAREWPAHELEVASREGRFEDEGWRVRKDGSQFWANVVITALRSPDGELMGFAKLTRDMTERRRIQILEQSERQNSQFLAMLAHELRNPLAPIHNALGIMRMAELDDPGARWSRDVIERQTGHLTRMVDDLLDVSRLTTGKIRVQQQLLELDQIITEAVESAQPLFRSRKQEFDVQVRKPGLRVRGDPTRLSQIFLNLLNNAGKYTPEGGHISLEVEQQGTDIVISVRDDGVGIAPELVGRVFDLFTQADRTLARSEGGLGIGLTLVRQLTLLHGGTVEAYSDGVGRGARFVVRLPAAQGALAANETGTERIEVAVHLDHRVLVVDDNRDSAETMSKILELWGYPSRCVYRGNDVVSVVKTWRPRTILLDVGLPGLDGFQVLQELKAQGLLAGVTVAAMTGYGSDDDRARVQEAGFAFHFVKPVDLGKLRVVLQRNE